MMRTIHRPGKRTALGGAALLFLALLGYAHYAGYLLPANPQTAVETSSAPANHASERGGQLVPMPPQSSGAIPVEHTTEPISLEPVDRYAQAEVIEAWEGAPDAGGHLRRLRVVRSSESSRYPHIRVEDRLKAGARADGAPALLSQTAMVADQVLVRLRAGIARADLERLNATLGARIERKLLAPDTYLVRLASATLDSVPRTVEAYLRAATQVAYAEPNYIVYALETVPNDTRFSELYGMKNTGQSGGTADADIDATEAWDITTGNASTRVGVIDTGIEYTHPDLVANIWANPGETGLDSLGRDKRTNAVDDDGNGFIDDHRGWDFANDDNNPMDGHYHGTHVSGTIGGKGNNGQGVAGVCWTVTLVPIKFLSDGGSGSLADGVDSIYYGTLMGCHLTSNSWGGGGFSQALVDAISDADAHGILFVAAAGNNGANADTSPMYPAAYPNPNIISVAATDRNDAKASFSNYGASTVDLGAPGVDTLSCKLAGTYGTASGTSMATPHVAGVCALLKSLAPGLSHSEIKTHLLAGVDPIPALAGKCVTGGRLNAFKTLLFANGPYVVLKSKLLDDDGLGGTTGNNDGFANPGERIGYAVTLRNVGSQAATGVNGTLALAVPNAYVSLIQTNASYGNLPSAGEAAGSAQYLVQIAPSAPTPQDISFRLNIQDSVGNIWTANFSQTLYTSSQISGKVVRATGGTGIAGASVVYSGPLAGTATTAADGSYSFTAINGAYTLIGKASGFLDSAPRAVTTPPSAANVDFALGLPEIAVAPAALSLSAEEGAAATTSLNVSNLGDATLTYQVLPNSYLSSDSDQAGGPAYSWTEISGVGTPITGLGDDTNAGPLPIGFSFPFYGQNFSTFRVCSNGFLSFSSAATTFSNGTLPSTSAPFNLVAFFWDDLNFSLGGAAYYKNIDAQTLIVEFKDVSFYGNAAKKVTCQAILKSSGTILLQYQRVDDPSGCTVGVQNANGTQGLQVVANSSYLRNLFAVRVEQKYGAPWLSTSNASGSVAPGGLQALSVTGNAALLDAGAYNALLGISSNDPDEPITQIPATFTVTAAPRMTFNAQALNDDATAPSAGDGDGAAEPGEKIELSVTLKNTGHAAGSGLTGTLSTSDPNATIVTGTAAFANAATGGTVTNATPFVVQFATTAPNNSVIPFTLAVRDGAGRQWNLSLSQTLTWRLKLTGVVTALGTGLPISGATVSVSGLSGTSSATGSFQISGIPAGTFTATASKAGFVNASASLTFPPDKSQNFQLGFPNIAVSPASLSQTLAVGASANQGLNIGNTGTLPLTWSCTNSLGSYSISNSDQPGGPVYNWIEISANGTPITGLGDDNNLGPYPIGFAFPFYGQTFSSFRVCSNGWLSFTSTSSSLSNTTLPSASAPENLVAFFWDDLNFSVGGTAYYRLAAPDTLVVQFKEVPFYGNSAMKVTCQAILKADGSIVTQYLRTDVANGCTVGLQNGTRTKAALAAYNQALLHANFAVRFAPAVQWLSIAPASGTNAPGQTTVPQVTFDAATLMPGSYSANLTVASNDLETPNITLPVSLTVTNSPPAISAFSPGTPFSLFEGQTQVFEIEAWDPEGSVLAYQWLLDGAVAGGNSPNFTYAPASGSSGAHSLSVTVSDPHGGSAVQTWAVTVKVPQPPTVNLTAPATGAVFVAPASIALAATATDPDGSVAKVEFYNGAALLGQDLTSPYSFTWGNVAAGTYTLQAKAFDNTGLSTLSSPITVTVIPTVTLSVPDAWASEPGSDAGRFQITRTSSTAAPLTVLYTRDGTAANGTDYQSLPGSVVIPAGSSYVYVYVTPLDDTLAEGKENVTLTLAAQASYKLGTAVSGSINLLDNEQPVIAAAVADAWASEPGLDTGRFTLSRSGPTGAALTVNCALSGTAANGSDYALLPASVTFPVGAASTTITLSPLDDALLENKETAILTVLDGPGYQTGPFIAGTVNLLDSEMPILDVSVSDALAAEPANAGQYTITRGGNLGSAVTVLYTMSGSATKGVDYAAPTGTVTIPAGQTSATVALTPLDDTLAEGKEYAYLNLSQNAAYQTGPSTSVYIYLWDDEKPEVKLAVTDSAASETGPDGGLFTASCFPPAKSTLTLKYALAGTASNGTDYAALSGTVQIAAGQSSATVAVAPVDDNVGEATETVAATLMADAAYQIAAPSSGTVNIADNEPAVSASAPDSTAAETAAGLPANPGRFRLTRSGGNMAAALTVGYALGGTASNGGDYLALSGLATIPAGATSLDLAVTAVNDALVEGLESAVLTVSTGPGYRVNAASATVTLLDDELPLVTAGLADASAAEPANSGAFRIARTGSTAAALTVNYGMSGTAGNGADYQSLSGSLVIPAGASFADLAVAPLNDSIAEGRETVTLTLMAGPAYQIYSSTAASLYLYDDDQPWVTLAISDSSATEAPGNTGRYRLTRTPAASTALTVQYAMSGAATNGADYGALSGSVAFPPGAATVDIELAPINDAIVEGNETATMTLLPGALYQTGSTGGVALTIVDND